MHPSSSITIGPLRFALSDGQMESSFTRADDAPTTSMDAYVDFQRGTPRLGRGEPDYRSGRTWSLFSEGACRSVVVHGAGEQAALEMRYDLDEAKRFVVVCTGEDPRPFRRPLDSIATKLALQNGTVLHAACAKVDGCIDVFVGPSGQGKTTLSRLLLDDAEILSDDRTILHHDTTEYQAYGTPWCSDLGIARNDGGPLGRIFVLRHASRHLVTPISPARAFEALAPCASLPVYDERAFDQHLTFLQRLVTEHEVLELAFAPTRGVVDVIRAA